MIQSERTAFRQSQRWRNFREVMKILHNSTCELCGSVKKTGREQAKLNVHHLYPDDYDNIDDHNDFVLLCFTCHEWVEFWVTKIKGKKFAPPLNFSRIVACIGEYLSEPARSKAYNILGITINTKEKEEMKSFSKLEREIKDWQEPSTKVHPATLIGIYDVGTQKQYQSDVWEDKRTIVLRFELMSNEKTNEGKNFIKDKQFKWSNHTKASIMKTFFALGMKKPPVKNEGELGGWYKIPKDFDYKTLLGRPCFVTIDAKQNGNGTKITDVGAIVEGMQIAAPTNPLLLLDWDAKDFDDTLSKVPLYIANMVLRSQEVVEGNITIEDKEGFADDVPF